MRGKLFFMRGKVQFFKTFKICVVNSLYVECGALIGNVRVYTPRIYPRSKSHQLMIQ